MNSFQPQSDPPTSTPKYVPPHLRHNSSSSSSSSRPRARSPTYRDQPYLTLEDLHARYSANSPPLRMPRVQRSLSAEDLYQRYRHTKQENQLENKSPNSQAQGQDPPDIPAPPRDFRAFRAYRSASPFRQSNNSPSRPILSPRLPDPPIFNGTDRSKFEDWKLRILDKLNLNKDHYLTNAFQINYVISRLGGRASEYIVPRRRETTVNPYVTTKDILD